MGHGFPPLPPLVESDVHPVSFPRGEKPLAVMAMVAGGGRLWMAVKATEAVSVRAADPAIQRSVAPASKDVVRLWSVPLDGGIPERVKGAIATNEIGGLAFSGEELWCTTDGNAVAVLDIKSGQVRRFFNESESETEPLRLVAADPGHVFVLGRRLFASEDGGRSWRHIPIPELGGRATHQPDVDRLFLAGGHLGLLMGRTMILDLAARRWMRLDEGISEMQWPLSPQTFTGDGRGGFWLSGSSGTVEIVPADKTFRLLAAETPLEMRPVETVSVSTGGDPHSIGKKHPPGWKEHLQSLMTRRTLKSRSGSNGIPGPVNGLAVENDWVWMTTGDTLRSYLHLYNRKVRQWVAAIVLPYHPPRNIIVSGDTIWLGGYGSESKSPLHCLRRAPLVAIPPDRWVSEKIPLPEKAGHPAGSPTATDAMQWLMDGNSSKVVAAWGEEDEEDLMPFQLFCLSLAFDEWGDKQPARSKRLRERLIREHSGSIFSIAIKSWKPPGDMTSALNPFLSTNAQFLPVQRRARFDLDRRLAEIPAEARSIMARYDEDGDRKLDRNELKNLFASEPGRIPFVRPQAPNSNPGSLAVSFAAKYLHPFTVPADLERLTDALERLARDQASGEETRPLGQ